MQRVMVRLVFVAFLVVLADNNLARAGFWHEVFVFADDAAKAKQKEQAAKAAAEIARATEAATAARSSRQLLELNDDLGIKPLSLVDLPGLIRTSAASTGLRFTYMPSAKSPLHGPDANTAVDSLRKSMTDRATEVLDKASSEARDSETGDAYVLTIKQALPRLTAEYQSKGWSFDASSGDLTIPVSIKVHDFTIQAGSINLYEISKKVSGGVFGSPSPAPSTTAQDQASPTKPVSDPLVFDFSKPCIINKNSGLSIPHCE